MTNESHIVKYYRYKRRRDAYLVLDPNPHPTPEGIAAGKAKLLSGAILIINWTTGMGEWRFANRVPEELRHSCRLCVRLDPDRIPYNIAPNMGGYAARFREQFPGEPFNNLPDTYCHTIPPPQEYTA